MIGETSEYNPYQYLRVGRIREIITDTSDPKFACNFNTAIIVWLDRVGVSGSKKSNTSRIKLTSSHISSGHGFQYIPSKGDYVICGFRMEGYPVILGYWDNDYLNKTTNNDDFGYYFRNIVEGEYLLRSKFGAEWYLDKHGSIKLIVRDPSDYTTVDASDKSLGVTVIDNIVKDIPQVEVTVGQVFENDVEIKSSNNQPIRFQIKDIQSGTTVIIDKSGNVEIKSTGKMQLDANDIEIGSTTLEPMVKGMTLKRWSESHFHTTPVGPSGVATVALPDNALSTKTKVE